MIEKSERDILVDNDKTFGDLKFSAYKYDVLERDEETGERTGAIERRVYTLKSPAQEKMIQVSIQPETEKREFPLDTVVELVNPFVHSFLPRGRNAKTVTWIVAEDIVAKKVPGNNQSAGQKPEAGKEQKNNSQNQQK